MSLPRGHKGLLLLLPGLLFLLPLAIVLPQETAPPGPQNVSIDGNGRVSWDEVEGADFYYVRYDKVGTDEWDGLFSFSTSLRIPLFDPLYRYTGYVAASLPDTYS